MPLFRFRGVQLRVHPLFPLMLFSYILAGQWQIILAYLIALFLHEGGHLFIALRLHLPVSQLELTPFGGAMQIDLAGGLPPHQGLLLASAGVCANAVLSLAMLLAIRQLGSALPLFASLFLLANLMMLLVNLVPVLPLDGGRILLSLLSIRLDRAVAFRALLLLGRTLSLLMLGYCAAQAMTGAFRPSLLLLGCYLLYASALEERHSTSRYLAAFIARRVRMEKSGTLPLQHLCASSDLSLHALLAFLQPGAYHRIEVIDPDGATIRGTLQEDELLQAVLNTPFAKLGDLLHRSHE